MDSNFRRLLSHYQIAAQDLAYAARRCRELMTAEKPPLAAYRRFEGWIDMVAETHRRRCELLGLDTGRVPARTQPFPLTDQQVHEAWLTDPVVHALGTIFRQVRETCVEVTDEQLAALAVYALSQMSVNLDRRIPLKDIPTPEEVKALLQKTWKL